MSYSRGRKFADKLTTVGENRPFIWGYYKNAILSFNHETGRMVIHWNTHDYKGIFHADGADGFGHRASRKRKYQTSTSSIMRANERCCLKIGQESCIKSCQTWANVAKNQSACRPRGGDVESASAESVLMSNLYIISPRNSSYYKIFEDSYTPIYILDEKSLIICHQIGDDTDLHIVDIESISSVRHVLDRQTIFDYRSEVIRLPNFTHISNLQRINEKIFVIATNYMIGRTLCNSLDPMGGKEFVLSIVV